MSSPSSSTENEMKIKLASEQERACQIAELKAEVAKLEQVDQQLTTLLEQIKKKAGMASTQIQANSESLAQLKLTLAAAQEQAAEPLPPPLDLGVQAYLARTCDDPFELGCPVGYGNVRELSKQAGVALHLVAVQTGARAKMQKLAKVDYKVEDYY